MHCGLSYVGPLRLSSAKLQRETEYVMLKNACFIALCLGLTACQSGSDEMDENVAASSVIGENETVMFGGTEPFWGGEVAGSELIYTTPENIEGTAIAVSRRAGLGGTSWSGELNEETFMLAVSEQPCSDGMSDRTYPYSAMLQLGRETPHQGCAWTDASPYREIKE